MAAAKVEGVPRGSQWGSALVALLAGAAVVGLLVLLWLGLQARDRTTVGVASVPFRDAPAFTLGLFDGSEFRLAEELQAGKPVVMNFWASWCVPCRDEAPVLEAAWRREREQITFLGVNVEDIEADARAFMQRYGMTFPNGAVGAPLVSVSYGRRGVPETYFISTDGQVVRKWNGPLTAAGLDQFIGELRRASSSAGAG